MPSRLHLAVNKGDEKKIKQYLKAGDNINAVDERGFTPLMVGVRTERLETVRILLDAGADTAVESNSLGNALTGAAIVGNGKITESLLRAGANPNKPVLESLQTPLHIACSKGHLECVRFLLMAGANVSAADRDGRTPLHSVLVEPEGANNEVVIIELLLSAGADFNIGDNDGNAPLFYAVQRGNIKTISLLLEAGSDVKRLNKLGSNALFLSVDLDIVKLLLAKGADATVVDIFGYTVLHTAVSENASAGVICALFRAGADPTARSFDGHTPAETSRIRGHTETAKLLELLENKYRETTGSISSEVQRDEVRAAKMSVAAALLDEAKKIAERRDAERGVGSRDRTGDDITDLVESFRLDIRACEEVKESVDECKDDQQQSSSLPCLNCEAMTSRRCSGCGISYFCSKKCEMTARHVCCG